MPPPTQEDFDSATSVDPDVVKMTDLKLDPVLAEGGGEPGKNRFEQTNDVNPFLLSQDIDLNVNPRVKTRFEEGLSKRQNKLGHDTGLCQTLLTNPVTYGHKNILLLFALV